MFILIYKKSIFFKTKFNKIKQILSIFLICKYPNFLFSYIRDIFGIFGSVFSFKFFYEKYKAFYILCGAIVYSKKNQILNYKIFFTKSKSWNEKFRVYFIKKNIKNEKKIKNYEKNQVFCIQIKCNKERDNYIYFLKIFRNFASCSSNSDDFSYKNQGYVSKAIHFYNFITAEYCCLAGDGEFFSQKKTSIFVEKSTFSLEQFHNNYNSMPEELKNFGFKTINFHNYFLVSFIRIEWLDISLRQNFCLVSKLLFDFDLIKKNFHKFSKNFCHFFLKIKIPIFMKIHTACFSFFKI